MMDRYLANYVSCGCLVSRTTTSCPKLPFGTNWAAHLSQVGSFYEFFNKNAIFGIVQPDSPLWLPILALFAVTGLPTAGDLWPEAHPESQLFEQPVLGPSAIANGNGVGRIFTAPSHPETRFVRLGWNIRAVVCLLLQWIYVLTFAGPLCFT